MVTPPSTLGFHLESKQLRTIKQVEVRSQTWHCYCCYCGLPLRVTLTPRGAKTNVALLLLLLRVNPNL